MLKKIQRIDPEQSDAEVMLDTLVKMRSRDRRGPSFTAPQPSVPRRPEKPARRQQAIDEGLVTSVLMPSEFWFEDAVEGRDDFNWSPLFNDFSKDELAAMIGGLRLMIKKPGSIIYTEGEPGDSLFVLSSGSARVYPQGQRRPQRAGSDPARRRGFRHSVRAPGNAAQPDDHRDHRMRAARARQGDHRSDHGVLSQSSGAGQGATRKPEVTMTRQSDRAHCLILCAGLLLTTLVGSVFGQSQGEKRGADPDGERIVLGALSYRIHCLNCHGDAGAGNGPMARLLKIVPADLARLSVENGGEFPTEQVYRTIDGRDDVRAHGSREMPVWGISFQDLGRDSDQEEKVRNKILDLIAYLRTLQVGGEETEDPEN